ncbi:MAG: polyprenyl synthetase family protein [Thalassobaculales bacterium]
MLEPVASGFTAAMAETAAAVEEVMALLLPLPAGAERRVVEAMRHGALGGGKRLRAFLVAESARLFAVDRRCALRVAAAVEFLHAYSLIHDDLPAMDDAELRRGRPSCHVAFDEATAILAGDGLQALAFEVLAGEPTHGDPHVRAALVQGLAVAAGAHGMVGGQMIDLLAETEVLDIGAITRLQRLKTGALIEFSAEAGAILGRAPAAARQALRIYAQELGLAFQIADDLLDHEGREEEIGKPVGRDATAGKSTFVSLLGAERAREQARRLADQAVKQLDYFGDAAAGLAGLARFVVERRS